MSSDGPEILREAGEILGLCSVPYIQAHVQMMSGITSEGSKTGQRGQQACRHTGTTTKYSTYRARDRKDRHQDLLNFCILALELANKVGTMPPLRSRQCLRAFPRGHFPVPGTRDRQATLPLGTHKQTCRSSALPSFGLLRSH